MFDRNYEEDEPDPLAQAIFDRVNAPAALLEEFSKKMDAIEGDFRRIKLRYLLGKMRRVAKKRHHGKIHGVVDFEHWDAHIDLTLPVASLMIQRMSLLKDIEGEKGALLLHYPHRKTAKFHFSCHDQLFRGNYVRGIRRLSEI